MELHLVADTNLFFECRRLEELPWEELGGAPVVVLMTRPVMAEIDKHKNGSGRTKRRALAINTRVRGLLDANQTDLVIREAEPHVLLRLAPIIRLPDDLRDDLDYAKTDDRLIGILATLARSHADRPDLRTELFTDDTGANATARALELPFRPIPGSWKRAEEEGAEAKEVRELRRQLAELRAQEPHIVIEHEAGEKVEVVRRVARALTGAEVEETIGALKTKHLMMTDFTPPPVPGVRMGGIEIPPDHTLEPPDEADIRRYQTDTYPAWLDRCREVLSMVHKGRDEPEPPIHLCWRLRNEGSRPATRVRVEFEAEGPLVLMRPSRDDAEIDEEADVQEHGSQPSRPTLPHPPTPPPFKRVATSTPMPESARRQGVDLTTLGVSDLSRSALTGMGPALNAAEAVRRSLGASGMPELFAQLNSIGAAAHLYEDQRRLLGLSGWDEQMSGAITREMLQPSIRYLNSEILAPRTRDPEEFCYDGWTRGAPVRRGALTCDLWRHRGEAEHFEMDVVFEAEGATGGTVRCTVHADNLTAPATLRVVVRRTSEEIHLDDEVRHMVEGCG